TEYSTAASRQLVELRVLWIHTSSSPGRSHVMSCGRSVSLAGAAIFWTLFSAAPASAQVDLSGQWGAINQSDARTRGPGPDLADYLAVPLNDEGRAAALAYSYSVISMPERVCMH